MRRLAFLSLLVALIAAVPAAAQILIPAAGNLAGGNGTFFKSDITIFNDRSVDQKVLIQWLPQGGSPPQISPIVTIKSFSGIISEDFVGNILSQTGLGAILLTPLKSDNTFDPNSALIVTSRIWTPQPGTTGTASQSFPAVNVPSILNTN